MDLNDNNNNNNNNNNYTNIGRNCNIDSFDEGTVEEHSCGRMDQRCDDCNARYFRLESNSKGKYTKCCNGGKVQLAAHAKLPELFEEVFAGVTPKSKMFLKKTRQFNTKLSVGSVSINSHDFRGTFGVPSFRASGAVYHTIGSIEPAAGATPAFLQCFFLETNPDDNSFNFSGPELELLTELAGVLRRENRLIRSIKTNMEIASQRNLPLFTLTLDDTPKPGAGPRTYNLPTCSEIAALIPGDGSLDAQKNNRCVVITNRDSPNSRTRIKDTHSSFDPVGYACTHPNADCGWTYGDKQCTKDENGVWVPTSKNVTAKMYYSYRLQVRDPVWDRNDRNTWKIDKDILTFGGLLFQQYLVDQWVKVEHQRLEYIRNNQTKMKKELYQGLAAAVAANDARRAGNYTVLPSSVVGTDRYMAQGFQDAMAIVNAYGKPSLFVTMTCNPAWEEIESCLRPNEKAWQRPDLVSRVYSMKLQALLDYIIKDEIYGKVIAYVYVTEFQVSQERLGRGF